MKLHEYLKTPLREFVGIIRPFPTNDYIGLEVELENIEMDRTGDRTPTVPPPEGWTYHIDDSLRNNGLEFVFDGPVAGVNIANRLENLITWIKANKLKPDASSRTSVHVHMDAGGCTIEQLFKWTLIYTVYEHLLFEAYAPERRGSNFCVPVHDAFDTKKLIAWMKKNWLYFFREVQKYRGQRRYSALNLDALQKFGSMEFRHLGGTYKPKPIIDWVQTLMYLKAWAMNPDTDIGSIFHGPSKYYCQRMTKDIFNEEISEKFLSLDKFTELYLEGARTAQEIYLDERIPEMPVAIFPKIEEMRQAKKSKRIELIRKQVNEMKDVNLHQRETLQPEPTDEQAVGGLRYTTANTGIDLDVWIGPNGEQGLANIAIPRPRPNRVRDGDTLPPPRPLPTAQQIIEAQDRIRRQRLENERLAEVLRRIDAQMENPRAIVDDNEGEF